MDPGWSTAARRPRNSLRRLISDWLPDFGGAIVYVPTRNPDRALVPNFAARLAELLGIGVSDCLIKVRDNAPQKLMQNSAQQIANVSEVFEVRGRVPAGNILLVDDVSDSRWTMTVLGELLRGAGSGPVHPFAVAKTKG